MAWASLLGLLAGLSWLWATPGLRAGSALCLHHFVEVWGTDPWLSTCSAIPGPCVKWIFCFETGSLQVTRLPRFNLKLSCLSLPERVQSGGCPMVCPRTPGHMLLLQYPGPELLLVSWELRRR